MDLLFLVIIVVLLYLIYIERNQKKKTKSVITIENKNNIDNYYPYKKVNSIMTKYEMNFFLVLSMAINDKPYYICPKVRLADIINVDVKENYQSYFNKIKSKHIDYLICDKQTFKPLYAIELDDSSHELDSRILRDDFLNNACYNAGIKLVRFKAYQSYKVTEIKEKLDLLVPSTN